MLLHAVANRVKQMFRNIVGGGKFHIDFWLGKSLRIPTLQSQFFHLKGRPSREIDDTPELFKAAKSAILECFDKDYASPDEIVNVTTKSLYIS